MNCIFCNSTNTIDLKVFIVKPAGLKKYKCKDCKKFFTSKTNEIGQTNMTDEEIMENIEKTTEAQVTQLNRVPFANINQYTDSLMNIMSDKAKEFNDKTGRQMTYSEMRQMFG